MKACLTNHLKLYGILQYRSMRASQFFAEKAQRSTDNMELVTHSMHDIAQKTKQETVSMRIITLVTLFFLPGTFIGVRVYGVFAILHLLNISQTFMSTDIIRFNANNTQDFQVQGLKLYLGICLPLMLITFSGWYGVYWWVNKRQKGQAEPGDEENGLLEEKSRTSKGA